MHHICGYCCGYCIYGTIFTIISARRSWTLEWTLAEHATPSFVTWPRTFSRSSVDAAFPTRKLSFILEWDSCLALYNALRSLKRLGTKASNANLLFSHSCRDWQDIHGRSDEAKGKSKATWRTQGKVSCFQSFKNGVQSSLMVYLWSLSYKPVAKTNWGKRTTK